MNTCGGSYKTSDSNTDFKTSTICLRKAVLTAGIHHTLQMTAAPDYSSQAHGICRRFSKWGRARVILRTWFTSWSCLLQLVSQAGKITLVRPHLENRRRIPCAWWRVIPQLYVIITAVIHGRNRSWSDIDADEDGVPFLVKSHRKLWVWLADNLSQRDLHPESASHSPDIPGIMEFVGVEKPYRIMFQGTSRKYEVHIWWMRNKSIIHSAV